MRRKMFPALPVVCFIILMQVLCMGGAIHGQERKRTIETPNGIQLKDTVFINGLLAKAKGIQSQDSLLGISKQILHYSQLMGYDHGIAYGFWIQGSAYMALEQLPKAEAALKASLPYFARSEQGKKKLPEIWNSLGNVNVHKAAYDTAIQYYRKGIDVAGTLSPPVNADYLYNNLAGLLIEIGRDMQSARYYLEKAESMALQHKNFKLLATIMHNKGFAFNARQVWDSSLFYFNRSLSLSRQYKQQHEEFFALLNIAIVLLEQRKPAEALAHLQLAKKLETHLDQVYSNQLDGPFGQAYLLLGNYTAAEPLLVADYRDAVARDNKRRIREAHYRLYQLYGTTKNYTKAYEHAHGYITLNNAIGGDEIIRNVNQEEVSFRTAEKDKELLAKKLIIEQQGRILERKNRWLTAFFSGAAVLLLIVFIIVKTYHNKQRMLRQKMSNLQQQKEIERLKANMEGEEAERARIARELHDGIGGLISAAQLNVRTLGKENHLLRDSEVYRSTGNILEEVAVELRKTANNMMPNALVYQHMEEAIGIFCNFIKRGRNLSIDLQCFGDYETLPDSYRVAIYRIVQELLNNIAKHAEANTALVQLMIQEGILSITIEDNGKGFDQEKTMLSQSAMGLKNVKERVKRMSGVFSLDTEPGKGTSVYIELEVPDTGE